jgi:hypothetical protein
LLDHLKTRKLDLTRRCAAIASRRRAERGLNLAGIVVGDPRGRSTPAWAIDARPPARRDRSPSASGVSSSLAEQVSRWSAGPPRIDDERGDQVEVSGAEQGLESVDPAGRLLPDITGRCRARVFQRLPTLIRGAARSSLKTWSQNYFCTSRQRSIRTQARVSSTAGRRGHVWRTSTFRHLRCVTGCPGEPS